MKGRVAFWFRIRRQGDHILCEALFKLFGQQCNFCNHLYSSSEVIIKYFYLFVESTDGYVIVEFFQFEYLAPLWYPDQIENVISFLESQVAKTFYGCGGNSMDHFIQRDRLRRSQPKHSSLVHHNSSRCQACKDGWCSVSGHFINAPV